MEKRLIFAILISMLILLFFQFLKPQPVKEGIQTVSETQKIIEPENRTAREDIPEKGPEIIQEYVNETITSEKLMLSVNSLDCGISQLLIKDNDGKYINMVMQSSMPFPAGIDSMGLSKWEIAKKDENTITAHAENSSVKLIRRFTINEDNIVEIDNEIINKGNEVIVLDINQGWYGGLGTTEELENENSRENRPFCKINNKVKSNIEKGIFKGKIEWAGLANRYFIAVFLEIDNAFESIEVENEKGKAKGCGMPGSKGSVKYPSVELKGSIRIGGNGKESISQSLYCGVKEYKKLKSFNNDLDGILALGLFGFLSKIFLNILLWFNSFTGNFGVAIILLTVLLQICIFPLTIKSFKSMNAMKGLQPKINTIRSKFKDDAQRMNQEIMHMYKKHNVNPVGGCLPLLLQMPIFISLFTMLRAATELRFAGFLWISDLSKADILFSAIPVIKNIPILGSGGPLPILMGGAMFLQQKMTGGGEGPQKNLMYIMPIVFTFLFMKFPSGLVLYWLSNSILTFAVQYSIGKKEKSSS